VSRRAAALAAALLALACAGRPVPPATRVVPLPVAAEPRHDEPALVGVVHVVRRGETVWRIARAYGIDPAELMASNAITDPRAVAAGTKLFVPGATVAVPVPPADADGPPPRTLAAAVAPPARATVAGPDPGPPHDPPPSPRTAAAARRGDDRLAWPLRGVLYGRFGVRGGQRHDGIDIAAPEGTVIGAAADGEVIYAGEQAGYGEVVIVRHDDGLVTLYAHNSRVLVGAGARVRRGDAIARVGQTGRTTGPHLHFEVREGTRPRNPLLFLP
jgi:lipoprotein NlpD